MKTFFKNTSRQLYLPLIALMVMASAKGYGQASILYTNASSTSTWQTSSNWTGSVVPTATDVAQLGANPTGSGGVGIDMGATTNNGTANQAVGAVEQTSARTSGSSLVGNNSTVSSGVLTFMGTTVNAVPNVIIRNNSSQSLTFQNVQGSGTSSMSIALGNTTDNRILQDAGGKIIISSMITGGASNPLTVAGIGTSEVDITNTANTFSGLISLLASETVFSGDGSFGAVPSSVVSNAITIDGGRMTANATYTLNSNRGIKLGNTAGTSISVKTGASVLTYNGVMADLSTNGSWAKQGGNVFQIGGANLYSGSTSINNGTIRLINGNNRLPVTTTLNLGQAAATNLGTFDLNGFNQQIAGLNSVVGTNGTANKNTITTSGGPATLTLGGAGTYSYGAGSTVNSGVITGSVSLIKNGSGLQVLGDVNTYTGSTAVNAGELRYNPVANETLTSSPVTLNGGTLSIVGIASGKGVFFSTLNLTDNSVINLDGSNTNTLSFAGSSAMAWTAAKTLTINGWQGTYSTGTPGTLTRIFVGTTASDLTAAQLSQVVFFNGSSYFAATLLSTGELVPFCTSPVMSSVSGNTVLCAGSSLSLSASATSTLAPGYLWSGPNSYTSSLQNPVISAAAASVSGVYTVTATNACGSASAAVSVTVNALPVVAANTTSASVCTGQSITLSGSGANTYTWSNGVTDGAAFAPAASNVYTVTGTSNNCSNQATVSITVNTTPTLSVNAPTICAGSTVALVSSGAATYTWSSSASTASISVSPAVTTNYTVTGANPGCSSSLTTAVTVYSVPVLSVNAPSICAGSGATLTASGANTYTWSTSSNTSSVSVNPASTTVYTISGSSSQACVSSLTVAVTVYSLPVITSFTTSVCSGGTATLTASGAATYTWTGGSNGSSLVVSPVSNVSYTVTGTSAQGCVSTVTTGVIVSSSPSITVNSSTICTGSAITLTATGVSSYTWSTGATTATISVSPTTNSVYTVSGNASGCAVTISNTATVSVNPLPTVTVNSATICSGSTTTLTVSGATTYSWSTSSTATAIAVNPTATTNYTVTGTSNNCPSSKIITVTVNANPTVTVNSGTICSGSPAILTASGASTYSWSNGVTTSTAQLSPASNQVYTVTGTSTLNCTATATAQIIVNSLPTVAITGPTAVCAGASLNMSASGAISYTWSTAPTSTNSAVSLTPAVSATYTVTGTGLQGCSATATLAVTVNTLPLVSASSVSTCAGSSTVLTASGTAVSYTWSSNGIAGASTTVTPLSTTIYTVLGSSANGCYGAAMATVSTLAAPNLSVTSASICAGGTATLTASGAFVYAWINGSIGSSITVSPASSTVYPVGGISVQGCTAIAIANVLVNSLPVVSLNMANTTLCTADNTVALAGTPAGGSYSGAGVTGNVFSPSTAGVGNYTISYQYTDSHNCSASANKAVSVNICTGIRENAAASVVRVSPNPAQNEIFVQNESFEGSYSIAIYDLSGKQVHSSSASQAAASVNISDLPNGLYIMHINSNNTQSTVKFIKN